MFAADFGSALRDLGNAEKSVKSWDCDFMGKILPDEPRSAQRLHASLCFIEQNGFEMPADALGGRVGEYSCGPTSFCLEEVLSTKPAKLCIECRHSSSSLLRGFSCDLATSQCVCGERELAATKCATTQDCSLVDSVCNVQASFYKDSYSAQLCLDSPGRSYCMKRNMHDGVGTCTSLVNEPANLMPTCQVISLTAVQRSFTEDKCLGYGQDLQSSAGGVLLSETFVFPCLDIVALGQVYKMACIRIILDTTIQNSILSFLTYNILSTPAFGFSNTRRQRRLLSESLDLPTMPRNTMSTAMLSMFVQQSVDRIHAITGTCRTTLQLCALPLQDSECITCARLWWLANFTMTTHTNTTQSNWADNSFILPSAVCDTDLLDVRHAIVLLAHNSGLLPRILQRAPHGVLLLFQDWLQDDSTYHIVTRFMRRPILIVDDFVYGLMQSMRPSRAPLQAAVDRNAKARCSTLANETNSIEVKSGRRLLQQENVAIDPVPAAQIVDTRTSLSKTRDTAIKQLHAAAPFFDVDSFGKIFGDVTARNKQLPDDLATILTETFSDAFDSPDASSCMLSFGTVQNDIIMNFARVLAKDGWTVKPVCTRTQLLAFSKSIPVCPILTAPFTRAYTNTLIIAEYYAHMVSSTCLTNMSVSCMKKPEFDETGIINALPRLSKDPKFTNQTLQDLAEEKDVISYYILRFFYAITDFVSFDRTSMMASVMAFASTDALYDKVVRDGMVRRNEYSIGRLLHDYFNCNLAQTISCDRKNMSLLPVLASLFIVISIIHFVLPIPSVLSFFLWTLGLTYGVVYMCYNFSPLCSPRIPTCMGNGLYEMMQQLLPLRIQIPATLYHADKCNSDLTMKPEFAVLFPGFACGKTCLHAPYKMKDVISVLIAFETWIRYGRAVYLETILTRFNFILPYAMTADYIAVIDQYGLDIHKNVDGYVLGFVTCIFFNFYKLIAFFIVITIFLPFFLNLVFSMVTFFGVLVLKYSFFAYGTDIYANMH